MCKIRLWKWASLSQVAELWKPGRVGGFFSGDFVRQLEEGSLSLYGSFFTGDFERYVKGRSGNGASLHVVAP
jgi:hypothetical protein